MCVPGVGSAASRKVSTSFAKTQSTNIKRFKGVIGAAHSAFTMPDRLLSGAASVRGVGSSPITNHASSGHVDSSCNTHARRLRQQAQRGRGCITHAWVVFLAPLVLVAQHAGNIPVRCQCRQRCNLRCCQHCAWPDGHKRQQSPGRVDQAGGRQAACVAVHGR